MARLYEFLDDLESQIRTTQQKQSEPAESNCCIYNVPSTLLATNGYEAYVPQFVSIGPRHSSRIEVENMEKLKVEFLADLLKRKNNLGFNDLLESIRPDDQEKAKKCYSKGINLESFNDKDRFLKKMVLDGCFLIELFLKTADKKSSRDPLAKYIPQAVPRVYGDLLMVGNQIPFFVLEELFKTIIDKPDDDYEISRMPEESINASLSFLALRFFYKVMQWPDGVIEKFRKRERATFEYQNPLHLLDLVRSSLLPLLPSENKGNTPTASRFIHSISKLSRAGIKLKLIEQADSFLEVKFRKGAIQMPKIIIDYTMKTFLLNCVAFELLHNSLSKHFTVYATFLDCLVDTSSDVGLLCESNILDSYFGKYDDVVQFINKMGKDLVFDDHQFYLSHVFKGVSDRYQSRSSEWLRFFNTTWKFISSLAGLVLLVLTLLQTFYTISAYYVK